MPSKGMRPVEKEDKFCKCMKIHFTCKVLYCIPELYPVSESSSAGRERALQHIGPYCNILQNCAHTHTA